MLGCGVLINLAGVMFSSNRFQESYYEGQRDFITYCAIVVIVFSVLYYIAVVVAEITAGSQFMVTMQTYFCCCLCPDKGKIREKNLAMRRSRGEEVNDGYEDEDEHPICLSSNPLMMARSGNAAAQKKAEADSAAATEQLKKMQQQLYHMKKNQRGTSALANKKSFRNKKGKKTKTKKSMGSNKVSSIIENDLDQQIEMSMIETNLPMAGSANKSKKNRRLSSRELMKQESFSYILDGESSSDTKNKARRMSSRELMSQGQESQEIQNREKTKILEVTATPTSELELVPSTTTDARKKKTGRKSFKRRTTSTDGRSYYEDTDNPGVTQWTVPADAEVFDAAVLVPSLSTSTASKRSSYRVLADGWGRKYYQDMENPGVTQWELPTDGDIVEDQTEESQAAALKSQNAELKKKESRVNRVRRLSAAKMKKETNL